LSYLDYALTKKEYNRSTPGLSDEIIISSVAGNRTSNAIILNDPKDGKPALFFIFPDVSLRVTGVYRFKCVVLDLQRYRIFKFSYKSNIIFTEPFGIFTVRNFSAIDPLTTLTKSFALQGKYQLI
jgi:hypothetical protein